MIRLFGYLLSGLIALSVMLSYGCGREVQSIGEHIYFQDDDCLIMGRGERSYDWGPGENTYRLYLLCRDGDGGDYGSDEFLVTSSVDLITISAAGAKKVEINYCPMFNIIDPATLRTRLDEIMDQYPSEMRLAFTVEENTDICVSVYGEGWREIEQSRKK